MGRLDQPRRVAGALRLTTCLCLAVLLGVPRTAHAGGAHKNVLVLYSENRDIPSFTSFHEGLLTGLHAQSEIEVAVYSETLDTARLGGAEHEQALHEFMQRRYARVRIDLVIAVLEGATTFLAKHRKTLFSDVPVLFFDPEPERLPLEGLGPNATGVSARYDYRAAAELMLQVHPGTRRVVVVAGASAFDRYWTGRMRDALRPLEGRVAFSYLTELSLADALERVAKLPPDNLVFYTHMFRDGAGAAWTPSEVAERLSRAASVPAYGAANSYLGRGIVGGLLYSFDLQGSKTAALALRLLRGERAVDIPVSRADISRVVFDWRQLRRWDVDEELLPPASTVEFKRPTFWDRYRWHVMGVIVLCALEGVFIAWLLAERRRRKRATRELERRIAEQARAERTARESEARYRSIVESTSDGVLVLDFEHRVIALNAAFQEFTGRDLDELRRVSPGHFLHFDDRLSFDEYLKKIPTDETIGATASCSRPDGELRRLVLRARRFSYGGQPHVLCVVRDVTERERAYELLGRRVTERTRELSMLLELSNTLASTLELEPLLRMVLERLRLIVPYSRARLLLDVDDQLTIVGDSDAVDTRRTEQDCIALDELERWPEQYHNVPLIIEDRRGDELSAQSFLRDCSPGLWRMLEKARSAVLVPLRVHGRTTGLLFVESTEPRQYGLHESGLAWALASHAAVAIENARLYDQARELAAFEERQRLARDLHDSVSQTLHAITLTSERLPRTWEQDPAQGMKRLQALRDMAQIAFAELRTLLMELRPVELLETKLDDVLRQLAEAMRGRIGAPVQVFADKAEVLPERVHVTFYRVAQESLSNIAKYAAASSVTLRYHHGDDGVTLTIQDDGRGFDPLRTSPGHMGISIMRERAASIGATLTIDSTPGGGTRVTLHWTGEAPGEAASSRRPSVELRPAAEAE